MTVTGPRDLTLRMSRQQNRSRPPIWRTALAITPGFELMLALPGKLQSRQLSSPVLKQHGRLLAEARDERSADRMEPAIRNFIETRLAAQGLDAQTIELAVSECRATSCQVQAVEDTGGQAVQ
jgi:hypothetical protein